MGVVTIYYSITPRTYPGAQEMLLLLNIKGRSDASFLYPPSIASTPHISQGPYTALLMVNKARDQENGLVQCHFSLIDLKLPEDRNSVSLISIFPVLST